VPAAFSDLPGGPDELLKIGDSLEIILSG
jgi:hypothetical protein